MSKELNIIEVMQLSIGTEVESKGGRFSIDESISGSKALYFAEIGHLVPMTEEYVNSKYIVIEKPVSFNEVLDNITKKVKIIHSLIGEDTLSTTYNSLNEVLGELGYYYTSEEIKDIIENGKWYIES